MQVASRMAMRAFPAVMVLVFAQQGARGATIYQTGFEPPTYSVGQLVGQNGWTDSTIPVVETTTVFSGSQAAGFNASADTSGQSLARQPISYSSVGNPSQLVRFQAEFFVSAAGVSSTNWDVIAVFGNTGFLTQMIVFDNTVAFGTLNASLGFLPMIRGQWNSYEIDINYSNDVVSGYINGTLIGSGSLSVPDTTATSFAWGINGSPGTDMGYIDNILITSSSAVPEPSSVILAGIAILMVAAYTWHRDTARPARG